MEPVPFCSEKEFTRGLELEAETVTSWAEDDKVTELVPGDDKLETWLAVADFAGRGGKFAFVDCTACTYKKSHYKN